MFVCWNKRTKQYRKTYNISQMFVSIALAHIYTYMMLTHLRYTHLHVSEETCMPRYRYSCSSCTENLKIIDARYQLSTVFSTSVLPENRWNHDNGRQLLWEWQYHYAHTTAIHIIIEGHETAFNGFWHQMITGKSSRPRNWPSIMMWMAVHVHAKNFKPILT